MSNWNKVGKPIVVLCAICVVITAALAGTNAMTAPIIEAARVAAENAARTELLPEAEGNFEPVEISAENVNAVYRATNGSGVIITSTGKGYGGTMTVMVAFTPEGTIKQLKVTEQQETKGIGDKVSASPDYWSRYFGLEAKELVLGQDVDALAGSSVSSKALNGAVNAATAAYNMIP